MVEGRYVTTESDM